MDRALRWFIRVWIAIAIVVNVISIAGFFVAAGSFWAGWQRVTEIYGPFNLYNYVAEVVLLLPAVGAYMWLLRRQRRAGSVPSMSAQEAQGIVNAYGAAAMTKPEPFPHDLYPERARLEEGRVPKHVVHAYDATMAGAQTAVRDIKTLPYPKERIKQALLVTMRLIPPGTVREQLKAGFVMLADWQDPKTTKDPVSDMLAEGKALLAELQARGL